MYGIHFITNGGETHPNLDMIDGAIEAEDLRLRLEIGGAIEKLASQLGKKEVTLRFGEGDGITVKLHSWFAAFGEREAADTSWRWEIIEEDGKLGIDWVLYHGVRKTLDFRTLNKAALMFSLLINNETVFAPQIHETADKVTAAVEWQGESMNLTIPLQPLPQ